jgi:uncharacterized protein (DUF697 family)
MLKSALRLGKSTGELWKGIQSIEPKDIHKRVADLKRSAPKADLDELHTRLVYAKCLETGTIGAVSGALHLLPGIGKFAASMLGPLADESSVSTLQAELVAETFALYGVELPPEAERVAVLAIAATNIGTVSVGQGVGRAVVARAGKLVGGRLNRIAGPLVDVVSTAATNIAVTYAVGKRSQALAKMKHADLSQWPELLRAVTMIDERKLARWATDSAQLAMDKFSGLARLVGEGLMASLPKLPDLPVPGLGKKPAARKTAARKRPAAPRKAKAAPRAAKRAPAKAAPGSAPPRRRARSAG